MITTWPLWFVPISKLHPPFLCQQKLLDEHVERGQLIISEIVYAELASLFSSEKELSAFLSDTGTKLTQSGEKALCIAGNRWNEYAKDKNAL